MCHATSLPPAYQRNWYFYLLMQFYVQLLANVLSNLRWKTRWITKNIMSLPISIWVLVGSLVSPGEGNRSPRRTTAGTRGPKWRWTETEQWSALKRHPKRQTRSRLYQITQTNQVFKSLELKMRKIKACNNEALNRLVHTFQPPYSASNLSKRSTTPDNWASHESMYYIM